MNEIEQTMTVAEPHSGWPVTMPITVDQYEVLVERGDFDRVVGQVELINGRIVHLNPQGPPHSDPIDILMEWSVEQSQRRFTIRVEKPIRILGRHSCPEPDIAWVQRRRYRDRHPNPEDIHLLIEVSVSSGDFDKSEKLQLYAAAGVAEYWRVDVPSRTVVVHRNPEQSNYLSIQTFTDDATIQPLCLPEASLPLSDIFGA